MSTHLSLTGLSPSLAGFPKTFLLDLLNQLCGPNPDVHAHRFGLFRFRSPLLPESHVVFSSSGYLDVSVHRVPSAYLWIQYTVTEVSSAGFPHSEICGSKDMCSSPQLIAAYHVFLRLLVPRHPPCALISLTWCSFELSHLAWCYFRLVCYLLLVAINVYIFMLSHSIYPRMSCYISFLQNLIL